MIDFDLKSLVPYLEEKGWETSYSLDARAYWNCTWDTPDALYVIEVPVWPFTKVTFLKHKVRGKFLPHIASLSHFHLFHKWGSVSYGGYC